MDTAPQVLIERGWRAELDPLLFGQARVIVTDGTWVEHEWMYARLEDAALALSAWRLGAYAGEPQGWKRAISHNVVRRACGCGEVCRGHA